MKIRSWLVLWTVTAACLGCAGGAPGLGTQTLADADTPPFEPISPRAYTNKVKNLLIGLPATDAEIAAVQRDPNALRRLVSTWVRAPDYEAKMVAFLATAFQQSQPQSGDFADQGINLNDNVPNADLLLGNLRQSFARTVLYLDAQNQPFTAAMTTRTFMMTTPLAAYYAALDAVRVDDRGARRELRQNSQTFQQVMGSFTAADFAQWRPVTVRQPRAGEALTDAGNAAALAAAQELVLLTPRQSFFSTPAFFAGWPTNTGNQARVTVNQTVITALGKAFDGQNSVMPATLAAADPNHIKPNTPCLGCHVNLDPMRQFFRQAYTLHYSAQNDTKQLALPGSFAFQGVRAPSGDLFDLGDKLATHPLLAAHWVQKLCTYANDAVCDPSAAEFERLLNGFVAGGYVWSQLVVEMFASPLVTYARKTPGVHGDSQNFPVAKRDHLCPTLSNRLGIADVCGLDPNTKPQGEMNTVKVIASILPANGYSRGTVAPVLANDPSLFLRAGTERLCAILADRLVDGQTPKYKSTEPQAAIAAMVGELMGLDAAAAATPARLLQKHFDVAQKMGASAADALKSTFVVACLSPSVMGVGQ